MGKKDCEKGRGSGVVQGKQGSGKARSKPPEWRRQARQFGLAGQKTEPANSAWMEQSVELKWHMLAEQSVPILDTGYASAIRFSIVATAAESPTSRVNAHAMRLLVLPNRRGSAMNRLIGPQIRHPFIYVRSLLSIRHLRDDFRHFQPRFASGPIGVGFAWPTPHDLISH
jgi:hypothetical protein